ncbi:hypothetical protein KFE25_003019 [Diacronema lutheri]|uniref:Prolyl endopeptidase n=2 Tax=Diacronema lutheri TaxID=2081491 RepID=A0A8J6C8U1_DIALT|nr:hypothetical protein KFE25_003019 [Diacronema lutheri]
MLRVESAEDGTVTTLSYPQVRRDDSFADELHGVRVPDPYRHLEEVGSEETARFVAEQNSLTQSYLFNCGVDRSQVLEELQANYDYAKVSSFARHSASLLSFWRKDGLQQHAVLYTCAEPGGAESVLLDPNVLSSDGSMSVASVSFSNSAHKLAYALADGGSDWRTLRVRDVASVLDDADEIRWAKFTSIEWAHDDSGFYYGRFAAPAGDAAPMEGAGRSTGTNTSMGIYLHALGSAQSDDKLVFEMAREDDKAMPSLEVVDKGRYLCVTIRKGKFNQVWVRRTADAPPSPPHDDAAADAAARWGFARVVADYEAKWELVTTHGGEWLFFTNCGAPRYHIVAVDIEAAISRARETAPGPPAYRVVVAESEHTLGGGDYAKGGHRVGDKLLLKYMNHVKDELHQHALNGSFECVVPLPELGVVSDVCSREEDSEVYFRFESFLTPPVIYRYSPQTREPPEPVLATKIAGLDTSEFMIEQLFATSKDGTRVPLFVVRAKELLFDGESGAALFAYGGFNVVKTISFDPLNLTLLQLLSRDAEACPSFWRGATAGAAARRVRGVWALANVRGGGEYGKDWHQAATGPRKQNTFDDFAACAELLAERKYTSARKLAIHGASNGGLLVAAAANQRPELFGCVLCQVGLLDMLRFHRFTIGHFWCAEYGSPDDADAFGHIRAYSPYHNVAPGRPYPPIMLTTADHDDRVVPLHTYKMAAQLQHVFGSDVRHLNPILVRVETKAGHGSGTATSKRLEAAADMYTFVLRSLGIKLDER